MIKQLSRISSVPRVFGWGTQPRANSLEFAVGVELYWASNSVGAIRFIGSKYLVATLILLSSMYHIATLSTDEPNTPDLPGAVVIIQYESGCRSNEWMAVDS